LNVIIFIYIVKLIIIIIEYFFKYYKFIVIINLKLFLFDLKKKIIFNMASTDPKGLSKISELSLYELHRSPQEAITDNTEIAVSPRSLHSELMCPICLNLLKKTMTTKECLHR